MSTDTAPAATSGSPSPSATDAPEGVAVRRAEGIAADPARPADQPRASAVPQTGWVVPLIVLVAGMFMSVLDTSIVNVAISRIQGDFGGSTADVAWVTTAYSLVLGVVVPATAWLGDRFGLARLYTLALMAFAVGSALCGLAWSLDSLIAFRIVQAVPGGILPAVTLTMVYRIVPRNKIGTAMGMYGLGIIFAPAIGPALGGYLVEYFSWRLVFYINVPIAVVGVLAAIAALPPFPAQGGRPFDIWGFVSAAYGLVALLLAFSKGAEWGWTGFRVLALLLTGVLSLALFVTIELEVDHPLLDLRVFRFRPFVISLAVMGVMMTGLFATLFYIPFFLQAAQGYQAFETGLLILPQALVMAVLVPVSGRLYDKIGPRWLVVIGLSIAAFGSYLLAGINMDMTRHEVVLWTCVRAAGNGMAMMAVMTSGTSSLTTELTPTGSAVNTIVQRVSAALGLAALTAMATSQQTQLAAGRSPLIPHLPRMPFPEMYAIARRVQLDALATSYANVFLLTAGLTALAALGGLLMRSGAAPHEAGHSVLAD
jgi:EmrB/QacA subfamily drug resistance transporter